MTKAAAKQSVVTSLNQLEHLLRSQETSTPITDVALSAAAAREIIEKWGKGNRPVSDVTVQKYKGDMENNRWRSHSPIGFGVFPDKIQIGDGQHRLIAQDKSSTTQVYSVQAFSDSDEFEVFVKTVDSGKPRKLSDLFSILETFPPNQSARAQAITNFMMKFSDIKLTTESQQDKVDYATSHLKAIRFASSLNSKEFQSHVAAAIAIAHKKHQRVVEAFVDAVHSGVGLAAGSPALVFKNALNDLNCIALTNKKEVKPRDRAMAVTLRVIYDHARNKKTSHVKKTRTDSKYLHEVITYFISSDVADQYLARHAKEDTSHTP